MAVKDLVSLYELSTSPSNTSQSQHSVASGSPSRSLPPSTPARFIRHGTQQHLSSTQGGLTGVPMKSDSFLMKHLTTSNDHNDINVHVSLDITDHAEGQQLNPAISRDHSMLAPTDGEKIDYEENARLLSKQTYLQNTSTSTLSQPEQHSTLSSRLQTCPPHNPVPVTAIFARKAAPLYLPKLDSYLSSLPPPAFSGFPTKGENNGMFPPMGRLAASGHTLDDLEANARLPSIWTRRRILGALVNIVLGLTGSSALATFYSLQGLVNTVQIFALILSTIVPVGGRNLTSKWQALFLGTIPNVLALNFGSTLMQSLFFLLMFMAISAVLLYIFYRSTPNCERYNKSEGLQSQVPEGKRWGLVIVTFLLTVIYLPLSTMAVHVLVWSQDLWIVPNPYINATTSPPMVAPLGPSTEFRDPLDFCWTTTMRRNEVNYAPVVIVISAIVFLSLTIWFPVALRRVIQQSVPKVDPYNELGRQRSNPDMDREYQRLLSRDRNPFAFLYSGFRRNWGAYESTYLFAKLSTLLIVAVIDPDNCFFRTLSRARLSIARQVLLLLCTIIFFFVQCFLAPFLDPVNNASEWTSRLNYVTTSALALAVALNIPGKDTLNTYVLYVIYVITYGLSLYFTIINMSIMHRAVKRLTHRIDFSIDIFSPRLDLSRSSIHTRRRIWQESITTLFLTSPECAIPKKQPMTFSQARDSEFPPYLLDFCGSPAERHVENLKILREVGSPTYNQAVVSVYGTGRGTYEHLAHEIQKHFVGPDSYWKNPDDPLAPGQLRGFGNAWWIPFPPTLVIRYDDGPLAVLQEVSDLKAYISQNSSHEIQRRRHIRMSLRALDGQVVIWPYEHLQPLSAHSLLCCGRKDYSAQASINYRYCVLQIKRRGHLLWSGLQLGSGFEVELTYAKGVQVNGDIIGLNDDYDLTPSLAHFLRLNRDLISEGVTHVEEILADYRHHQMRECHAKTNALTYRFLSFVYDQPRDPSGLAESSIEFEHDLRVRQLMVDNGAVFESAYERLNVVSTSETATWWYILWDDLWRRNHDTIAALELYATDFNPYYPTSIAYTPLPRPALESFLVQRGLLSKIEHGTDFFHAGFLNKIYLRLNETVFAGSSRAIMFHLGDGKSELDMEEVDMETLGQPSSLGTGGGTDHDDGSIRARPAYRWETILSDPVREGRNHQRRLFTKLGAWFGITPLWRSGQWTRGVAVDVRLENGRYVMVDDGPSEYQSV